MPYIRQDTLCRLNSRGVPMRLTAQSLLNMAPGMSRMMDRRTCMTLHAWDTWARRHITPHLHPAVLHALAVACPVFIDTIRYPLHGSCLYPLALLLQDCNLLAVHVYHLSLEASLCLAFASLHCAKITYCIINSPRISSQIAQESCLTTNMPCRPPGCASAYIP